MGYGSPVQKDAASGAVKGVERYYPSIDTLDTNDNLEGS